MKLMKNFTKLRGSMPTDKTQNKCMIKKTGDYTG